MRPVPVVFTWQDVDVIGDDGEVTRARAMVPLARYGKVAARQFGDAGTAHTLEPVTFRDMHRHNHFFAALHEAFKNLPEEVSARWPTFEHFRKWVLIEVGYFDEKEFDCPSETFAKKLATFVRTEDEYARIAVRKLDNPTKDVKYQVIVRRAKSQAIPAMKPEEFYQSKKDVLDYASGMIGVKPAELKKQVGNRRNA